MTLKKFLNSIFKDTNDLFQNNKEAIDTFNRQSIPKVFFITIMTLFIPVFASIFRHSMRPNVPLYLMAIGGIIILILLSNLKPFKPYPMLFVYIFGLIIYALFLYLGVVTFQDRPAATLLIYFVVLPLLFIDRSYRVNLFTITLFLAHLILSYANKGITLGSIDLINTLTSVFLGTLIGRWFLISRLTQFETEKQLSREKETDFLTNIGNRRKLYNDFNHLEHSGNNYVAILVLDLDYFKDYNDKYGHLTGDRCLQTMGKLFGNISRQKDIKFYRFGGEEFVALSTSMSKEEIQVIAEYIRISIKSFKITTDILTVSIGYAFIPIIAGKDIDYYLENPDKALYRAKEKGRDTIVMYKD